MRRRRLIQGLLVMVLVIWLIPRLVAHTQLFDWCVGAAIGDIDGTLTVESASLAWLSPLSVNGLEVRDTQGKAVLRVGSIQGTRSLLATLWNSSNLGEFEIKEPSLNIKFRERGSNLEDVFQTLLHDESSSEPIALGIKVTDGTASIVDGNDGRAWQINKLQAAWSISNKAAEPMALALSGNVTDVVRLGSFKVRLITYAHAGQPIPTSSGAEEGVATKQHSAPEATSSGELAVEVESLPLAMLEAIVDRFLPQTKMDGYLSARTQIEWAGDRPDQAAVFDIALGGEQVKFATPSLGGDQVEFEKFSATARAEYQGTRLTIEPTSIRCDAGSIALQGAVDLGEQGVLSYPMSAWRDTFDVRGQLDLARLAGMLPETLRLRPQTRITSGQVQFELRSVRSSAAVGEQEASMAWQGRFEVSDVAADYRGDTLDFGNPVTVTLVARDSLEGPMLERLECQSDFFALHAAGTRRKFVATADFDLETLADRVGRFVDLSGMKLAGKGNLDLNWQGLAENQFATNAELQIRHFRLSRPGYPAWMEDQLSLVASAAGHTNWSTDTQLDQGTLAVQSTSDRWDVRLTQPVLDPFGETTISGSGTWPLRVSGQGDLDGWPARLAMSFDMPDCQMAGYYTVEAQAVASGNGMSLSDTKVTVDRLRIQTPTLNVDEPNAKLTMAGSYEHADDRVALMLAPFELTATSAVLRSERVTLTMPNEGQIDAEALVRCSADLGRVSRWFAEKNTPPQWRLGGRLEGTLRIARADTVSIDNKPSTTQTTQGELDAQIANLVVVDSKGGQYYEPTLRLNGKASYDVAESAVVLEQLTLGSAALTGQLAGQLARAQNPPTADLSGKLQYDLQRIAGLLRPVLGDQIQLVGRGAHSFFYRGPLSPTEATAEAGFGWQWVNVHGFQFGPASLRARLAKGILKIEPITVELNGGRFVASPEVRFSQDVPEFTLGSGSALHNVQIHPAMCGSMLQYIAPILAGATSASGSFSLELKECRVPLPPKGKPSRGDFEGRFIIHSAEVGPGPLIRELAMLMHREAPARLAQESTILFKMVNGRVYHEGLVLNFPDLTIRTRGSVGVDDQTLELLAEMPVPAKWVGNNPLGVALRNQTIRLPIGGTLDRPQIDRRALDQLTRQFINNAARNVISDQLNRLLAPPPSDLPTAQPDFP